MEKNKHTPGPWEASQESLKVTSNSRTVLIADCNAPEGFLAKSPMSNVRLIAQAPAMKGLLEEARAILDLHDNDDALMLSVRISELMARI